MQKTHQPTHVRKALLGLISLTAIFALMFGGSGTPAALAQAGEGSGNSSSTPATVIPHPHHNYKHVCTRTKVRGMNHCDSDVITDANGKALVLANSLVSPQTLASAPYGPAQLLGAYGESGTTSKTSTVAIVDAYDDPTVLSDLNTFSSTYSIPTMNSCAVSGGTYSSPCFQVVNETGGSSLPPPDSYGVYGWAGEISLDVQAVHAMCQNCNILLIEASSKSDYDLIEEADQTAVSMGANVVSNSWGECESGPSCEGSGETSLDSYFNHPGVPFVFSSGDGAYDGGTQYPAASPNVTAVGGTSLYVNTNNTYNSETVWYWKSYDAGAGSGCSAYEPKPSFQHDSGCSNRTVADVAADADPDTGLNVYVTDPVNGTGFYGFGGTSLSAPLVSSIYALAGGVGTTLGNSLPYANLNYGVNLRDVTSGSNGTCSPSYLCTAGTGYDGPTGLGTPLGTAAFTSSSTAPGAFNKSTPSNGDTGQSTSPTLQWAASSGLDHYEYCYGTSNPCSNWTSNYTTSVGLSGLTVGQTYYWNVRAVSSGSTYTYADGSTMDWSFTASVSAPGAFNKSSPSNGAIGQATSPTLQWTSSSNFDHYEYCYGTSNPCSNWTANGTSTSVGLSSLTAGQTYYWNVRAVNSGGTATYADGLATDWSFTTQSSGPPNDAFGSATVISTLPYTTSEDTTSATSAGDDPAFPCTYLTNYNTVWYRYTPSSSVNLSIDTFGSSYDTVLGVWTGSEGSLSSVACNDDYNGTLQSQVQFSASGGTTYYIEAASYSSGGGSLTLDVYAVPGPFNKSSPSNGTIGQSTSPTLQWTSSSNFDHYEYCYGTTNPCSNWTTNGTSTNVGLSHLSAGQTYYWNVRAVSSGGTATYADGSTTDWSFTTKSITYVIPAVFRPSNGTWYIKGVGAIPYGTNGDIPVPADYTGAGHAQLAVFRPSNGKWYIQGVGATQYGTNGDIPVPADYTGAGHAQLAVFRPSNGKWYINGVGVTQYGTNGDIPVPADYTGVGHAQLAVFRPSNGTWYIYGVGSFAYGHYRDIPVPADYNGDGKAELAVFRPNNGIWYIKGVGSFVYGQIGDIPIPGDYNGDGRIEMAFFRPINGTWYINGIGSFAYGTKGDIPVPGHYQ